MFRSCVCCWSVSIYTRKRKLWWHKLLLDISLLLVSSKITFPGWVFYQIMECVFRILFGSDMSHVTHFRIPSVTESFTSCELQRKGSGSKSHHTFSMSPLAWQKIWRSPEKINRIFVKSLRIVLKCLTSPTQYLTAISRKVINFHIHRTFLLFLSD